MANTPVAEEKPVGKPVRKKKSKQPKTAADMKGVAEARIGPADAVEEAVVKEAKASKPAKKPAMVVATSSGGNLDIPLSAAVEEKEDANHRSVGLEAPPEVTIPDGKVGESELEKARRVLQGTKGRANAIRQWLFKNGLPFIRRVDDIVEEDGDEDYLEMSIEVTASKNGEKSVIMKPVGQVRDEFVASRDKYLNWPEDGVVGKLIRRAARSATILFELSQAKNLPELHAVLADVYDRGYLDEADNGRIRGPGGKSFVLTDDKRFGELGKDEETTKEVVNLIGVQASRFRTEFYRDAKAVACRLTEESKMSVADLCDGQVTGNGLCALQIEPHGAYRDEGTLQIRLDRDNRIWPMAGSGRLQEVVAALQNSKAFIFLDDLLNDDGSLKERWPRFTPRCRMDEEAFKKWLGLRIKFWNLVHQGIENGLRLLKKQAEIEEAKQVEARRVQEAKDVLANDTPLIEESEWLAGNEGDVILVFKNWSDDDKLYPLIVIRVRREVEGEGDEAHSVVSIVNASPDSKVFLDGVTDKYVEEERFQGVKDPLGRLLRAAYGMKFGSGARK